MWLLIDDMRSPASVDVIVRNYDAALLILEDSNIDWEGIIFDHDLGGEKTGYDVLVYMINHLEFLPPYVNLITDNPVGLEKMGSALVNAGYKKINARQFVNKTGQNRFYNAR